MDGRTTGNISGDRKLTEDLLCASRPLREALRLYTIGSAWFSFDEDQLGSLEAGKLADLAVLSADILELEASGRLDDLRDLSSVLTIVDGDIVYSNGDLINCEDSDDDGIWYRKERDSRCVME